MSFMDIFPVFDEFLPYFSSYLSHLMFFTQFHAKYWKFFGASRHLRLYFVQFCVKSGKLSAHRAIRGFILPNVFVKNGKFSALRATWNMLWRFSMVPAWKNREEIGIVWYQDGDKFGTSGQNIYPWILLGIRYFKHAKVSKILDFMKFFASATSTCKKIDVIR